MRTKGFTLVELMVVVLIVGILAAVAIPMMRGRIDAAKWSEGKAGAGTVATAVRSYVAEKGAAAAGTVDLVADLGFATTDLEGTYFTQGAYSVSSITVNTDGTMDFTVTVGTGTGKTTADGPTTPVGKQLVIDDNASSWSDVTAP